MVYLKYGSRSPSPPALDGVLEVRVAIAQVRQLFVSERRGMTRVDSRLLALIGEAKKEDVEDRAKDAAGAQADVDEEALEVARALPGGCSMRSDLSQ
jgi:hypothetical protein